MLKWVISGLFILLIFIVFGTFIYCHRIPLNFSLVYLQQFFQFWSWHFIFQNLQEFFLLIILILSAAGVGYKLLKLFCLKFYTAKVEVIFSVGLGFGFFSLFTLGLGLLGLLSSWIFYPLVLCSFFISYIEVRYFISKIIIWLTEIKLTPSAIIFGICFVAIILLGLILNIGGPPILFDDLVYHLAIPDIYIKNHKIVNIPHLLFSNYPLNAEMLFTLAILLKSDTLAQLIHFTFGILSGVSIYVFTQTYLGRKQGLVALLIFFSMPSVVLTMSFAFNDLALTYYVILAVYAMLNWIKINDRRWLLLSGIMTGLAVGVKYSGLLCFIILFLAIIKHKPALKELFIFSLMVLLPVLPWLIKNLIFVKNPVYPFLYGILGGENWDIFSAQRFNQEMSHYGPSHSGILRYLILPFFITCDWRTGDIPIGPLVLLYLPFLFFIKNVDKTIKYLLIFCGLYFFFWTATSMVIRFLFPCIAFLCPIVAYVIKEIRKSPIYELPIAIALILNIYTLSTVIGQHADFYLGNKTRQEKLLSAQPVKDYYQAIKFINENLPPGSKILFIGEPRRYYCEKEVLTSTELDTAIISKLVKESKTINGLFHKLKDLKVTHILYNRHNISWLERQFNCFNWQDKTQKALYESFINSLSPIYAAGKVYLYEIKYRKSI
ncbi:MAG: glycosyltransferase family 39 protein [bacterium]